MAQANRVTHNYNNYLTAEQLFTDREEPRKAFWDIYDNMSAGEYMVLSYYGIGGIGKTTLLKQLIKEMYEKKEGKKKLSHAFFSFEGSPCKEEFLYNLSRQMMIGNKGLECPIFDYAMDKIARTEGKELYEYEDRTKETVENLVDIARSIGEEIIPYGETAGKVIETVLKFCKEKIKEREKENSEGKRVYSEIEYLETKIIKEKLHEYLKMDIWDALEKRKEPYVIFIDGYENFVSLIKDGEVSRYEDNWMHDTRDKLIELPNVLWVIAGREKLTWNEDVLPANCSHRIGDLSEKDAYDYFNKAGIFNPEMKEQLYKLTNGTPVYLDLCVKTYQDISKEKEPAIDDFGNNTVDLAKRYLANMTEFSKLIMIMLSWFPNVWNKEMAETVAERLGYVNYRMELDKLLKLSLFEPVLGGYRLHDTFKQVVREISGEKGQEVQKEVLVYLKEWLFQSKESERKAEKLKQFVELIEVADQSILGDSDIVQISKMIATEFGLLGEYEQTDELMKKICAYVVGSQRSVETRVRCERIYIGNLSKVGRYENMLELALNTYNRAESAELEEIYVVGAMMNVGTAYWHCGEYQKSLAVRKKCYEANKRIRGEEHPETLGSLNNLAISYDSCGQIQKALELNEKCYEVHRRIRGEDHPYTVSLLNDLAVSYDSCGQVQKALEMHEKCYKTRKHVLGEEHSRTLSSLNNLAASYDSCGQVQKALEMNEKCYEARKRVLGEEHPDTLSSLNNLAASYGRCGDIQKALEMREKCYESCKRILGEEHSATLGSLNNLAASYDSCGQVQKALEMHEKCYEARKRVLGEEHPDTLSSLNNLAASYGRCGDIQKALEMHEKCYEACKYVLGEEHSRTLSSLNNLAASYDSCGQVQKALEMHEKCYEARKRILGEEHPDTLSSLNDLAILYDRCGEVQKALEMHEKCYEARKRVLGEEHLDTLSSLNILAILYDRCGEIQKALELMEKCYAACKRVLGEEHPDTLSSLNILAILYDRCGEIQMALEMMGKCYEARKRVLGEEERDTLSSLNNLAVVYKRCGQTQKALEMHEKCYKARKRVLGEDHPDTLKSLDILVNLYNATGNTAKVQELQQKK